MDEKKAAPLIHKQQRKQKLAEKHAEQNPFKHWDRKKLLDDIHAQAEKVRQMKDEDKKENENVPLAQRGEKILNEVFKFLEMKYVYCRYAPEPVTAPELFVQTVPPVVIKLRWDIKDQTLVERRLQRPFVNRTRLTFLEVVDAIQKHQARFANKFPHLPGFLKIELLRKAEDGTKIRTTLTHQGELRLPLTFPGPNLAPEYKPLLKVHVPGPLNLPESHQSFPEIYKKFDRVPELVDCGVNLFDPVFNKDLDDVIDRAFSAGVSQLVLISTSVDTSKTSISIAKKRENSLFATVGVHPMEALNHAVSKKGDSKEIWEMKPEVVEELKGLIEKNRPQVVAVGEIGLDFSELILKKMEEKEAEKKEGERKFGLNDFKDAQVACFERQIQMAIELNLPILAHIRDAHKEFLEIISKYQDKLKQRVVVNCFTGTESELEDINKLDFYVSISGFIANETRAAEFRKVLAKIPPHRLMFGSDAPYLTPFNMPKPFPKHNEPAFLPHTLVLFSELTNQIPQDVAVISTKNSKAFFNLPTVLFDGKLTPGFLSFVPKPPPAKVAPAAPAATDGAAAGAAPKAAAAPAKAKAKGAAKKGGAKAKAKAGAPKPAGFKAAGKKAGGKKKGKK